MVLTEWYHGPHGVVPWSLQSGTMVLTEWYHGPYRGHYRVVPWSLQSGTMVLTQWYHGPYRVVAVMYDKLTCRYWAHELDRKRRGLKPRLWMPMIKAFWWKVMLTGVIQFVEVCAVKLRVCAELFCYVVMH